MSHSKKCACKYRCTGLPNALATHSKEEDAEHQGQKDKNEASTSELNWFLSNILRCVGRIRSSGVRCDVDGVGTGYFVSRRRHGDCSTTKGELGGEEGGGI